MRKVLLFIISCLVLTHGSDAAVRDGSAAIRAKSGDSARTTTQRLKSTTVQERSTSPRAITARTSATTRATASNTTSRPAARTPVYGRSASVTTNVISRAADSDKTTSAVSETRTGAEYEQCKTAYFTCMDQFCSLKDSDYRRCSCSNRVYDFDDIRDTMNQANEKLTIFKENLNAVGLTAEQATAMKTESDGEAALTTDKSASKALLQAIMNSISGKDTNVGGKFSNLNSINLSFDTANAFGTSDSGQIIAQYNGQNLYNAVYPQCRDAVRTECNDASLQRAITAYLMAIENDCNVVQTAVENSNKKIKAAIREGSAMLDLARVENRQKHNSDDIATCINNVEAAILSEQVCGAGYKKCLDNGEYIDVNTGKAIAGVVETGNIEIGEEFTSHKFHYKSTCAKQLLDIAACSSQEIIEAAFGGFDKLPVTSLNDNNNCYRPSTSNDSPKKYGTLTKGYDCLIIGTPRSSGVATEVYNQVLDILNLQCNNMQGRLIAQHSAELNQFDSSDLCKIDSTKFFENDGEKGSDQANSLNSLMEAYGFNRNSEETDNPLTYRENMCPRDYQLSVDTPSWGICSCWHNGGRRSRDGNSPKCVAEIPYSGTCPDYVYKNNTTTELNNRPGAYGTSSNAGQPHWCAVPFISTNNQVCSPLLKTNVATTSQYIMSLSECDQELNYWNETQFPKGIE